MAPTTLSDNLIAEPTSTAKPHRSYWTKDNIAVTVVLGLLFIAVFAGLLLYYLHYRSQIKKKKLSQRGSDEAGLLANEDKSSMFSRHRASSVTIHVEYEADICNKRASIDTIGLIPLQITPGEEVHDPISNNTTESTGSGVSALSGNTNTNTPSSIIPSPVSPSGTDGDLGLRPAPRARSSTLSQRARYYESTPVNIEMPPIPKIVHSPSK